MTVAWWAVPAGVAALAVIEGVALVLGRRHAHPPGVPLATRLVTLGAVLALGAGVAALVAMLVSLPIDDALGIGAAGVAAVVLVAVVLLDLARTASRP
jgi:hypothetical protein